MGCCEASLREKSVELNNFKPIEEAGETNPFPSKPHETDVRIERKNLIASLYGKITDFYTIDELIGDGAFSRVYRATQISTGSIRAVKTLIKSSLTAHSQKNLRKESEVLKRLDHPYIVKIHEIIEDEESFHIVTELCTGGSLFDRIMTFSYFSENLAANFMYQIVSSLVYCHKNGIVHRDIQPDNILFEDSTDTPSLKMIDFGTSKKLQKGTFSRTFIGTVRTIQAYYVAPEVIKGQYDAKCDVWSCGIVLYILLCGSPPFNGSSDEEIIKKITRGVYSLKGAHLARVSKEAKELLRTMLTVDPQLRPSSEEVFKHPWIQKRANNLIQDNIFAVETLNSLSAFQGTCNLKLATLNYIVSQLVSLPEIEHLRTVFLALDTNGDGKLSITELSEGFAKLQLSQSIDIRRILANCDADRDGFIEYTEFLAATLNWQKSLSQERVEAAFKAYDTDGSGAITLNELKEFIGDSNVDERTLEQVFNQADLNQDGVIDLEEFKSLIFSKR